MRKYGIHFFDSWWIDKEQKVGNGTMASRPGTKWRFYKPRWEFDLI